MNTKKTRKGVCFKAVKPWKKSNKTKVHNKKYKHHKNLNDFNTQNRLLSIKRVMNK